MLNHSSLSVSITIEIKIKQNRDRDQEDWENASPPRFLFRPFTNQRHCNEWGEQEKRAEQVEACQEQGREKGFLQRFPRYPYSRKDIGS